WITLCGIPEMTVCRAWSPGRNRTTRLSAVLVKYAYSRPSVAKSGEASRPSSPDSPWASTGKRMTARTVPSGSIASRVPVFRSLTQARPSGVKARPHGTPSPDATTSTLAPVGTLVKVRPGGAVDEEELALLLLDDDDADVVLPAPGWAGATAGGVVPSA